METQPVKYSLFIKRPSPDLLNDPEYMKGRETFSANIATKDLREEPANSLLPPNVYNFMLKEIEGGIHRIELLVGDTEYKLYVKPQPAESFEFLLSEEERNVEAVLAYTDMDSLTQRNKHKGDFMVRGAWMPGGRFLVKTIESPNGSEIYTCPHVEYWRAIKTLIGEGYKYVKPSDR